MSAPSGSRAPAGGAQSAAIQPARALTADTRTPNGRPALASGPPLNAHKF